ncbi:MAG: DUF1624 domain-containing protein [Gemmobacter sp.]|uniref:heparan-alpha-glucosaminide N-acetyltransferase n=1 Tax=Gemmobacter sp. TaxID=1898957 RepID=UPI001A5CC033|nr:heparan-alpha-glucosaminide N-acetyltransferase [Gemmobacter sp.]MBL8563890.1 DUF1624 domain-containing protein [Gemmobacter sp.]
MPHRLWILDTARTMALLGMVLFHFTYDLEMFGLLAPGTASGGFFWYHARAVAGSFLALAGVSLWLAHGQGIRWPGFWRRWLKLAAAAALVSLATRLAMPEVWVFFGILHAIALFSLIGLAFLRLPAVVTLALGLGIILASPHLAQALQWNTAALRFLGLGTLPSYTVDFEPVFPWFGPFLLGLGLARLAEPLRPALARLTGPGWLAWPGRHSLAIYLLHQPLLIGLLQLWLIVT